MESKIFSLTLPFWTSPNTRISISLLSWPPWALDQGSRLVLFFIPHEWRGENKKNCRKKEKKKKRDEGTSEGSGREQTKSLIHCKAKYSSYLDYIGTKDWQSRKWVWKTICILWSIDLGENGRACSHFELDTEKTLSEPLISKIPKDWRQDKEHWQDRQNSSPTTTQTPQLFQSKGFTQSPAVLFIPWSTVYWTVHSHLRHLISSFQRFTIALVQRKTKICSSDNCESTCPPGKISSDT